jgi:hypothetical protein
MTATGIAKAREDELIFEPRIKGGIPFWAPLLEMNAAQVWNALTAEQKKATHLAAAQASEPMRQGELYALKAHMGIVSGVRPYSPCAWAEDTVATVDTAIPKDTSQRTRSTNGSFRRRLSFGLKN